MATLTVYPDPDPETTSVDGNTSHVYTTGSGVAWGTLVAAAGTAAVDTGSPNNIIRMRGDNVLNQFVDLWRGIFLFDTSALGAGSTVDSATLSLWGTSKADALVATPNINIYSSAPASNTALAAGDFDSLGSTAFSTAITYDNWSVTAYNDFALNASGLTNISKTAVSKFGARNVNYDVANSAPPWADQAISRLNGANAEAADTTNDPKLVVTYTAGAAAGVPSSTLLFVGT